MLARLTRAVDSQGLEPSRLSIRQWRPRELPCNLKASSATGSGWGMCCPPSPGDQVLVVAQEGDAEHGIIIGSAYSNTHMPPNAPVGELWLVHRSGAFIKLQNDGTIRIQGDLHVAGDVYDQNGSLSRLRSHYNSHRHTDSHSDATSGTNQPD
jgi:uncharacterized protein involved in type VI secretion and phage assembly